MVQNICTLLIQPGEKRVIFKKPCVLSRVFFSIRVMTASASWYETQISFGDPNFVSYYMINGPEKYFEAEGADIFQGDIWVYNKSDLALTYALSEILHCFG